MSIHYRCDICDKFDERKMLMKLRGYHYHEECYIKATPIQKLKLTNSKRFEFNDEQIKFIKENYHEKTNVELAKDLGVGVWFVSDFIKDLLPARPPLSCPHCNQIFKNKMVLTVHLQCKHPENIV